MNKDQKFLIFLSKHFPNPNLFIVSSLLLFIHFILVYPILTELTVIMLIGYNMIEMYALLFLNHIRYEFKMRKFDCENLLTSFKDEYPELNFDNDVFFKEKFNYKNDFKYTEVIVLTDSDYRTPMDNYINVSKSLNLGCSYET